MNEEKTCSQIEIYLRDKDVKEMLKMGSKQYWEMKKDPNYPKKIYLFGSCGRYRWSDMKPYLDSRPTEPQRKENPTPPWRK